MMQPVRSSYGTQYYEVPFSEERIIVPRRQRKDGSLARRRAWVGGMSLLLGVGVAVCTYEKLGGGIWVNVTETGAVQGPGAPAQEEQTSLSIAAELMANSALDQVDVTDFVAYDGNADGVVTKPEFVRHISVKKDSLLHEIESSNLSASLKSTIASVVINNFAIETDCITRLFDKSNRAGINEQDFELVYPMFAEFCSVVPKMSVMSIQSESSEFADVGDSLLTGDTSNRSSGQETRSAKVNHGVTAAQDHDQTVHAVGVVAAEGSNSTESKPRIGTASSSQSNVEHAANNTLRTIERGYEKNSSFGKSSEEQGASNRTERHNH